MSTILGAAIEYWHVYSKVFNLSARYAQRVRISGRYIATKVTEKSSLSTRHVSDIAMINIQ